MKVLSFSMRPKRLERHLKQQHPALVLKTEGKITQADETGSYHTCVSQHLKASFGMAFMIAKQKKPHTIGEELIKPCILKATCSSSCKYSHVAHHHPLHPTAMTS
ncbi:unnamed protein product [Acanthoscelides obtectus]|uniref:Uncharacterized protein n=1 Tax=Acanthoscelides obtectus TaxID=200917 RepID=A0A9P0P824_ACAOB|nr:unnamed protein product [Acanthoscelides obtectus]CAK1654730.1 hypothetical protein AOBTE_LOCUS18798 [Acanthoscelides obtectus]